MDSQFNVHISFSAPIPTFFVYFSQSSSVTHVSQRRTPLAPPRSLSHALCLSEIFCKYCPIDAAAGGGGGNHYGTIGVGVTVRYTLENSICRPLFGYMCCVRCWYTRTRGNRVEYIRCIVNVRRMDCNYLTKTVFLWIYRNVRTYIYFNTCRFSFIHKHVQRACKTTHINVVLTNKELTMFFHFQRHFHYSTAQH